MSRKCHHVQFAFTHGTYLDCMFWITSAMLYHAFFAVHRMACWPDISSLHINKSTTHRKPRWQTTPPRRTCGCHCLHTTFWVCTWVPIHRRLRQAIEQSQGFAKVPAHNWSHALVTNQNVSWCMMCKYKDAWRTFTEHTLVLSPTHSPHTGLRWHPYHILWLGSLPPFK